MESFQASKEQEQKLLSLFKERGTFAIIFFILGLAGFVITAITTFGDASPPNYYTSSTVAFFVIGMVMRTQNKEAVKVIEEGNYPAYKTVCKKVGWEFATVDNNEILSKNVKKTTKKITILGSRKAMQAGDEIGILKTGKIFWAFPLK